MVKKTYLSAINQWDRTVAYWLAENHHGELEDATASEWGWSSEHYNDWLLGIITKPTKLFRAGDLVIAYSSNGSADRYNVYAVSSKGYPVKWMYMPFDSSPSTVTISPPVSTEIDRVKVSFGDQTLRVLYIPEPPFYLRGRSTLDPRVREYIIAMQNGEADKLIQEKASAINFVRVSLMHGPTGIGAKDESRPSDKTYTVTYSELKLDAAITQDLLAWTQSQYERDQEGRALAEDIVNQRGLELAQRVKQYFNGSVEVVFTSYDFTHSMYRPEWKPPVDTAI